jgi:hypothetical protein
MSKSAAIRAHERPLSPAESWASTCVSQHSCFGDDLWQLDIAAAGRRTDQKRLNWNVSLADGSRLTDPQHARLLNAAKQFLWSTVNDPPAGRKRLSPSTLSTLGHTLIAILRWMNAEGYTSFAELNGPGVERVRAWLKSRQVARTGSPIAPVTIEHYLRVLKNLYRQRAKLADAPPRDPLPMETTFEAAGVTSANKGWIPSIPDAVVVDMLTKALDWVTLHAESILSARDAWDAEFKVSHGARRRARIAFKLKDLRDPKGEVIDGVRVMRRLVAHLTDACFIVIAGFVGMRVSEILSMEAGCIEHKRIGAGDAVQAYVVARLFKTADDPRGRVERWLAPEPVVRAVEILEHLSLPVRKSSGRRELFITETPSGRIAPITGYDIRARVRECADYVGVPHHEGKPWHFSPISSAKPSPASLRDAIAHNS